MKRLAILVGVVIGLAAVAYVFLARKSLELSPSELRLTNRLAPPPVTDDERSAEELNIYEAIFRYRINHFSPVPKVFLRVKGHDPSDEFMSRFGGEALISKGSGWIRSSRHSVLLSTSAVVWMSGTSAEVMGSATWANNCRGHCGDSGLYHLSKSLGQWRVEGYVHLVS